MKTHEARTCDQAHLKSGVSLPYSHCALLGARIKGVSVHSDCKGDPLLVCPGIPLANACACNSESTLAVRRPSTLQAYKKQ